MENLTINIIPFKHPSFGLIVGIVNSDIDLSETKFDTNENIANSYQNYLEFSEKEIKQLSEERKQARERLIAKLKSTSTYFILVDSAIVSSKYLPLLTAVSTGIRRLKKDGNTFVLTEFYDKIKQITSISSSKTPNYRLLFQVLLVNPIVVFVLVCFLFVYI